MSSENPIVVASLSQTQEADQPLILSLDWWKPYAGQLMDLHHSSIPCFQQVHQLVTTLWQPHHLSDSLLLSGTLRGHVKIY